MGHSHKNAIDSLREEIAHTVRLLRFTYEAIISIDEHQQIVLFNNGAESIFGYSAAEVVGKPLDVLLPERFRDSHRNYVRDFASQRHNELLMHDRKPLFGLRKSGEEFPAEASVYSYRYGGEVTSTVVLRDVTQAEQIKERLQNLASHDYLTRLPNRLLFDDRLGMAIARAARNGDKLALVFIDIDNFKAVNDRYGHSAGDTYLKTVASRLRSCLRETDTSARVGGDEFALILENLHTRDNLTVTEYNLRQCLQAPFALEADTVEPSISLGFSVYPDDALEPETLLKLADQSMFQDKNAKRERR